MTHNAFSNASSRLVQPDCGGASHQSQYDPVQIPEMEFSSVLLIFFLHPKHPVEKKNFGHKDFYEYNMIWGPFFQKQLDFHVSFKQCWEFTEQTNKPRPEYLHSIIYSSAAFLK